MLVKTSEAGKPATYSEINPGGPVHTMDEFRAFVKASGSKDVAFIPMRQCGKALVLRETTSFRVVGEDNGEAVV